MWGATWLTNRRNFSTRELQHPLIADASLIKRRHRNPRRMNGVFEDILFPDSCGTRRRLGSLSRESSPSRRDQRGEDGSVFIIPRLRLCPRSRILPLPLPPPASLFDRRRFLDRKMSRACWKATREKLLETFSQNETLVFAPLLAYCSRLNRWIDYPGLVSIVYRKEDRKKKKKDPFGIEIVESSMEWNGTRKMICLK